MFTRGGIYPWSFLRPSSLTESAPGLSGIRARCKCKSHLGLYMTEWTCMLEKEPEDGEILFIPRSGITRKRMGTVVRALRRVLLTHMDIGFSDILYWIQIPEEPKG